MMIEQFFSERLNNYGSIIGSESSCK